MSASDLRADFEAGRGAETGPGAPAPRRTPASGAQPEPVPQPMLEPLLNGLSTCDLIAQARAAQRTWAETGIRRRVKVLRLARRRMVAEAEALARTVPLQNLGSTHRSLADTLASEVLPLVEACRWLDREAESILAPRREDGRSRPAWLAGVSVEVRREPLGVVLIIAPGNYPLFLPGAQALQALAAGNAVLWKPAPGGAAAALALRATLVESGLDPHLLQVLDESTDAATRAIRAGVDNVVLTGSAATGRVVLRELAETLTPAVMELSGCDAVFVLDGASLERAAAAIAFGLRLNGSATCMAPRRLFVAVGIADAMVERLKPLLAEIAPVPLPAKTLGALNALIFEAERNGASVICGGIEDGAVRPVLIAGVKPHMRIAQTDIAAPVLSMIEASDPGTALASQGECPYALTAAIFGPEREARELAARVSAGVVLINDIIVSTADPRAPFGGRGASGFGVTRGREGLLEMTAVKTLVHQRSRSLRAYQSTGEGHVPLFLGYMKMVHGSTIRERVAGLVQLVRAAMQLGRAA